MASFEVTTEDRCGWLTEHKSSQPKRFGWKERLAEFR
jgi:hypothetical protein